LGEKSAPHRENLGYACEFHEFDHPWKNPAGANDGVMPVMWSNCTKF